MPPAYEVLLLNTAIPQIQAAQSGDTYVVPRDIAINATAIISANSATDALRITQTGAGNALVVEDSANPDSTPFVVTAGGDVGVGASSPGYALDVQKSVANGVVANFQSTSTSAVNTGVAFRSSASNAANRNWALLANSSAFGDFVIRTSTTNGGDPVSGTDRLMIDPSGNLGLGVTPSAWAAAVKSLQIGSLGGTVITGNTSAGGTSSFGQNFYFDTDFRYAATGNATRYSQINGQHQWYSAPSWNGTGSNLISFTQAMTLDASGNLLVGSTTGVGTNRLVVEGGSGVYIADANNHVYTTGNSTASTANFNIRGAQTKNACVGFTETGVADRWAVGIKGGNSALIFASGASDIGTATERARITSGGEFLLGTANAAGTSGVGVALNPSSNGVRVVSAETTNAAETFSMYSTGASAYRFYVDWSGKVNATNTTIAAISDQRLKENVRDLDDGLGAIMSLKPRKFDWKAGKGKAIKDDRGFIAQEFEQVFPDMVDNWKDPAPEGEEPYKAVRADLIPVLVKAIQEQQAMIDELKAEVAALKGV